MAFSPLFGGDTADSFLRQTKLVYSLADCHAIATMFPVPQLISGNLSGYPLGYLSKVRVVKAWCHGRF